MTTEHLACKCGARTYEDHLTRAPMGHMFRLRLVVRYRRG